MPVVTLRMDRWKDEWADIAGRLHHRRTMRVNFTLLVKRHYTGCRGWLSMESWTSMESWE